MSLGPGVAVCGHGRWWLRAAGIGCLLLVCACSGRVLNSPLSYEAARQQLSQMSPGLGAQGRPLAVQVQEAADGRVFRYVLYEAGGDPKFSARTELTLSERVGGGTQLRVQSRCYPGLGLWTQPLWLTEGRRTRELARLLSAAPP